MSADLADLERRVTALERAQNDTTDTLRWVVAKLDRISAVQEEHTLRLDRIDSRLDGIDGQLAEIPVPLWKPCAKARNGCSPQSARRETRALSVEGYCVMSSVDKIHKIISNGIAWTIRHPDDPRKTSGNVKAYFEMRRLQRQGLGRSPRVCTRRRGKNGKRSMD